jgi:hypothetical protein
LDESKEKEEVLDTLQKDNQSSFDVTSNALLAIHEQSSLEFKKHIGGIHYIGLGPGK